MLSVRRRGISPVSLVIAASLFVTSLLAQPAQNGAPWKVPINERAKMRFGLESRAERLAEKGADIISGQTAPELFFPTELFDTFLKKVSIAPYADRMRLHYQNQSDDIFATGSDWNIFDNLTADYAAVLLEEQKILREVGQASLEGTESKLLRQELASVQKRIQRKQVEALRAVRSHFGRERFDRFLYLAVAPDKSLMVTHISDEAIEGLLRREREAE